MRICKFLAAGGPAEFVAIHAHMDPLLERSIRSAIQALVHGRLIAFDGFGPPPAAGVLGPRRWRVTAAGRRMVDSQALHSIRRQQRLRDISITKCDLVDGYGSGIGRRTSAFDTGHLTDEGEPQ